MRMNRWIKVEDKIEKKKSSQTFDLYMNVFFKKMPSVFCWNGKYLKNRNFLNMKTTTWKDGYLKIKEEEAKHTTYDKKNLFNEKLLWIYYIALLLKSWQQILTL